MKNTNTEKTNQLTTVKTGYARAALLLLALNFCLTGYCFMKMNSIVEDRLDSVQPTASSGNPTTTTYSTADGERKPTSTRESN